MATRQGAFRQRPALVIPVAAGVGVALAAVPLTWWAVGDVSTARVGQALGPFHVPIDLLYALAAVGVVLAVVSLSVIARASSAGRAASTDMSKVSAALLISAGVLTAAGGRFVTRGQPGGADIGGGLLVLFGPVVIVALLLAAAGMQWSYRRSGRAYAQRGGRG